MKKTTVLLGGVCVAALIVGGAFYFMKGNDKGGVKTSEVKDTQVVHVDPKTYWNGEGDINVAGQDGMLPLEKAVRAHDEKAVEYLIKKGARANNLNKQNISVLEVGLAQGNLAIVKMLTEEAHAVMNSPKYMKAAVESKNTDIIQVVLDHGGDVNSIIDISGRYRPDEDLDYMDPRVMTPLKRAVLDGDVEMAGFLLTKGAGGAPFFFAQELKKGHADMVKAMAKKVGNLRQMSVKGTDVLTSAVIEAKPDMLEFLLNENAGDVNGALFNVLLKRSQSADYEQVVDLFLNAGAIPTSQMLEYLIKKGDTKIFKKIAGCLRAPNTYIKEQKLSMLGYALKEKRFEEVKFLTEHGASFWKAEDDGYTPIFAATRMIKENPEFYQFFKSQLKNVDETGFKHETILMYVAQVGDFQEFQKLVDAGADIWHRDIDGKTVLMYAVEGGNIQIVKYLLQKGDNPELTDKKGKTALMYAAAAGQAEICHELLYKGVAVRTGDALGKSAIMYAAEKGQVEVIDVLVNAGESSFSQDKMKKNVAMYAAEGGDLKTYEAVIKKGVDVSLSDKDGNTILSYAVQGQNADIVRHILGEKANRYVTNRDGYNPYMYAIMSGNKEIADLVQIPIENTLHQVKDTGKNIAILALESGNLDFIKKMLRVQDNVWMELDKDGDSFYLLMAKYGRPDMFREMVKGRTNYIRYRDKIPLMYAAESEYAVNLITLIGTLTKDEGLNRGDAKGKTILMYAVGGKYNQSVKQQRLLHLDINLNARDKDGKTALMYAVGNLEARVDAQAVAQLIAHGADVSLTDKKGKTALMYALENKNANANVIDALLRGNASVHAKDDFGQTVLMYAAKGGDISKFRVVYDAGAELSGKSDEGKTVFDFADEIGSCFAEAIGRITK